MITAKHKYIVRANRKILTSTSYLCFGNAKVHFISSHNRDLLTEIEHSWVKLSNEEFNAWSDTFYLIHSSDIKQVFTTTSGEELIRRYLRRYCNEESRV